MTPANPDNNKPFIYRIVDALGITHLVVAVQHSHLMSEIEGLVSALAAKANAIGAGSPTGAIVIANTAGELVRSPKTIADLENAIAAKQDTLTFDNTPTSGSDNPVKSSGIYTALAGKAPMNHTHTPLDVVGLIPSFVDYDGTVDIDMDDLVTTDEGMRRLCIYNDSPGDIDIDTVLISGSGIPIHTNSHGTSKIQSQQYAIVTVFKIDKDMNPDDQHVHDLCYFVTIDGIFT